MTWSTWLLLLSILVTFVLFARDAVTRTHPSKAVKRNISGEVVVIIGASSGVGLQLAKRYARRQPNENRQSIHLHLVARSDKLRSVVKDLENGDNIWKIHGSQADATSYRAVCELAKTCKDLYGHVDTLIICAGALTVQPVMTLAYSPKDHDVPGLGINVQDTSALMDVASASYQANVISVINLCATFVPLLQRSAQPRIAVLSSVAAEIPAPTRAIYAANKAALSLFLRSLRIELESIPVNLKAPKAQQVGRKGVGITIVYPASIDTGLRTNALDAPFSKNAQSRQEHDKKAMHPARVANVVKMAIEDEADEVWLPGYYWLAAKVGTWMFPAFLARKAKQKYEFA